MSPGRGREAGYAVLAAMVAAACFAMLAAQVTSTSRSAVVSANAQLVHARLQAAAEAGLAMALNGLSDPGAGWNIDGQPRAEHFDGVELAITIEDERGKAPLNLLTPAQAHTLFAGAGADPELADRLVQAFLLARDPRGMSGAASGSQFEPTSASLHSQGFATVAELARLDGMTPALYAAIAPSVSVDAGDAAFEPRTATPLALQVMGGSGASPAAIIERQRELAGQRTAFQAGPPLDPIGRALTIRVTARSADGGRFQQASIVQLTRRADRPYVVRARVE